MLIYDYLKFRKDMSITSQEIANYIGVALAVALSVYVAKTKAPISCAVTAQLICAFGFVYAKSRFSHDAVHFQTILPMYITICTSTPLDGEWRAVFFSAIAIVMTG